MGQEYDWAVPAAPAEGRLDEARVRIASLHQEIARLAGLLAETRQTDAAWESRCDDIRKKEAALREELAERDLRIVTLADSARERIRGLEDDLRQAQACMAKLSQAFEPSPAPPAPPSAAPEAALAAPAPSADAPLYTDMPSWEPGLQLCWSRVLDAIRRSLSASYAHLRKLSAAQLADAQRALLKLAAGALAQGTDSVTMLAELLDETGAAPAPGGLDAAVAAALAKWEPALRQRGIALSRRVEGALPQALFQKDSLRLALYQVLRNAFECMPQGGKLSVRIWRDGVTGMSCVSFADTGPGFSAEALGALPAPASSPKPGHLGLGLALASRILGRWGGGLAAHNNENTGATVTLCLAPAVEGPPTLQEEPIE